MDNLSELAYFPGSLAGVVPRDVLRIVDSFLHFCSSCHQARVGTCRYQCGHTACCGCQTQGFMHFGKWVGFCRACDQYKYFEFLNLTNYKEEERPAKRARTDGLFD